MGDFKAEETKLRGLNKELMNKLELVRIQNGHVKNRGSEME